MPLVLNLVRSSKFSTEEIGKFRDLLQPQEEEGGGDPR
ncbi:MAG: hypothetical protein ACI9F9_000003 [Candidatus Paceibacteria bacterium]|jgi:hypothetical protein